MHKHIRPCRRGDDHDRHDDRIGVMIVQHRDGTGQGRWTQVADHVAVDSDLDIGNGLHRGVDNGHEERHRESGLVAICASQCRERASQPRLPNGEYGVILGIEG